MSNIQRRKRLAHRMNVLLINGTAVHSIYFQSTACICLPETVPHECVQVCIKQSQGQVGLKTAPQCYESLSGNTHWLLLVYRHCFKLQNCSILSGFNFSQFTIQNCCKNTFFRALWQVSLINVLSVAGWMDQSQ